MLCHSFPKEFNLLIISKQVWTGKTKQSSISFVRFDQILFRKNTTVQVLSTGLIHEGVEFLMEGFTICLCFLASRQGASEYGDAAEPSSKVWGGICGCPRRFVTNLKHSQLFSH